MRERRIVLAALGLSALVVGAWAAVAPASFYELFPAGRMWVAIDGPYNEHLLRDVGGLQLALAVTSAAVAWRGDATAIRVVAAAWLAFAVPHLAYHLGGLGPLPFGDRLVQVVSLSAQVIAPLWLAVLPLPRRVAAAVGQR